MADAYSRPDSWLDYLPDNWQHSINTSPILNALGRALNRRPADIEGASNKIFGQPGDREAQDRNWLLQQARGPSALERMNPVAQDGVNKLGLLANFIGPGAKLPTAAPKPAGIRAYHGSPHDFDQFQTPAFFSEHEGTALFYKKQGGSGALGPVGSHLYRSAARAVDAYGSREAAASALKYSMPDVAKYLENGGSVGRMYEVRIPEPTGSYVAQRDNHAPTIEKARKDGHNVFELFDGTRSANRELVVLDPSLITILRKYGLLPPVAAGTAAALNQQEPQL